MQKLTLLTLLLLIYTCAPAQDKAGEAEDQQNQMPNYLPEEVPGHMPNVEFLGSYSTDPETGKPRYYLDTDSGLYFDFDQEVIKDFQTGESYTFEELKELLRRAPADKPGRSQPSRRL